MEFKGTKGKWFYSEDIDTHYSQPVININSTADFETFITVWSGLGMSTSLDITTKANALLISKAPEMLEMLKILLKEFKATDVRTGAIKEDLKQLIKEATEL